MFPFPFATQGKLCVVLDLDGTLVSSFTPKRAPRLPAYVRTHVVGVGSRLNPHGVLVVERPGLAHFLERLAQFAEVVCFTAGERAWCVFWGFVKRGRRRMARVSAASTGRGALQQAGRQASRAAGAAAPSRQGPGASRSPGACQPRAQRRSRLCAPPPRRRPGPPRTDADTQHEPATPPTMPAARSLACALPQASRTTRRPSWTPWTRSGASSPRASTARARCGPTTTRASRTWPASTATWRAACWWTTRRWPSYTSPTTACRCWASAATPTTGCCSRRCCRCCRCVSHRVRFPPGGEELPLRLLFCFPFFLAARTRGTGRVRFSGELPLRLGLVCRWSETRAPERS